MTRSGSVGKLFRMGVKLGISLSDDTHARVRTSAPAEGESLSGFIDNVLRAEIARWKTQQA